MSCLVVVDRALETIGGINPSECECNARERVISVESRSEAPRNHIICHYSWTEEQLIAKQLFVHREAFTKNRDMWRSF